MHWFKIDYHHNIFHNDCTHKVIRNKFPVLVLEDIMSNMRKEDHRKIIPADFYQSVLDEIRFLHFSMKFEYDNNRQSILSKWKNLANMNDFVS